MKDWFHVAETPAGIHVHRLDPEVIEAEAARRIADDPGLTLEAAEAEVVGDQVEAIRDSLGFPPRMRWMSRPGWRSALSPGEPHAKTLAKATVHADEDDKGRLVNWRLPPIEPLIIAPAVAAAVPIAVAVTTKAPTP